MPDVVIVVAAVIVAAAITLGVADCPGWQAAPGLNARHRGGAAVAGGGGVALQPRAAGVFAGGTELAGTLAGALAALLATPPAPGRTLLVTTDGHCAETHGGRGQEAQRSPPGVGRGQLAREGIKSCRLHRRLLLAWVSAGSGASRSDACSLGLTHGADRRGGHEAGVSLHTGGKGRDYTET